MKYLPAILFLSSLVFSPTTFALPVLLDPKTKDTFAEFLSTSYSYDNVTDAFTITTSEVSPVYYIINGSSYEIINSRSTFSATIDDTGHVSSGNITWHGTVSAIPGINFDEDKIAEATVTDASYGSGDLIFNFGLMLLMP